MSGEKKIRFAVEIKKPSILGLVLTLATWIVAPLVVLALYGFLIAEAFFIGSLFMALALFISIQRMTYTVRNFEPVTLTRYLEIRRVLNEECYRLEEESNKN